MADAILEGKNNAGADVQRAVAEGGDEFVEVQEGASA
jgi:small subunit ribosomal protein S2